METATFDIIIGRDWISKYFSTIYDDNQIIKLHFPSEKLQQCCTIVTDNVVFPGFLNETIKVSPHTEVQTFLHLEDLPQDNTFKLTGAKHLVVKKIFWCIITMMFHLQRKELPVRFQTFLMKPLL